MANPVPAAERHWLSVIRKHLEDNGKLYDNPVVTEVRLRNDGKEYPFTEHIRSMIYSLLTNQRKWSQIEPRLPKIDALFFGYDPAELLNREPSYFIDGIRALKCGNISTKKQMESLADNIRVLQSIETEYGSLDRYVASDRPSNIVRELSRSGSPRKLSMMGEALAWEYIRGVGVDGAKPDTHLCRFLGADRMGYSSSAPAEAEEIDRIVTRLSGETGYSKAEIDNIIWSFCADGYGELCTAEPDCARCPIRGFCRKGSQPG